MPLSLTRIKHLIYRDAIVYRKPILYGLFSLIAFTIFIFWLPTTDKGFKTYDPEIWLAWFFSFLFFGGLILTSIIYWEFKSPAGRIQYLSLPASNIEKLIGRGLYTHVFYPLLLLVIFFLGYSIAKSLGLIYEGYAEVNSEIPDFMIYVLGAYLCAVSLMTIYAVAFNKFVAPKAVIITTIMYILFAIIAVLIFRVIYAEFFNGWNRIDSNFIALNNRVKLESLLESLTWFYKLILWVLIPGYFMTVAYFKMKEKEV